MSDEIVDIVRRYSDQKTKEMHRLYHEKDFEKAALTAGEVLQNCFGFAAIHYAGLSLAKLGRNEEAFEWCIASLTLSRGRPDWYANAVEVFTDIRDFPKAFIFAKNGLEKFPDDVPLHYKQALIFCHAGDFEQALTYLDATLAIDPNFCHARQSRGFCLHMLGRYDEALKEYALFESDDPNHREEIDNNIACVLMEMGRQREGLDILVKNYPNTSRPGTLYNRSLMHLGVGEWDEGWALHPHRQTVHLMPNISNPIAQSVGDLRGKSVFLFHEQGLGDTLQFVRYAKILSTFASHLTVGVPKPLKRLVETLELDAPYTVIADGVAESDQVTSCDVAIAMLDCPVVLQQRLDNVPDPSPYFRVPPALVRAHKLPHSEKPRIGVVWAGSSRPDHMGAHNIDKRRSVPFEAFQSLLDLSDRFSFISLQQPDHRVGDPRLLQPIESEFDLLDTAAITKQLDLVITIDSAMCHLAGALAVPVWMLSRFDGCWRWLWCDKDSPYYTKTPWYQSMRIFRQPRHHSWPEVINQIKNDLQLFYIKNP